MVIHTDFEIDRTIVNPKFTVTTINCGRPTDRWEDLLKFQEKGKYLQSRINVHFIKLLILKTKVFLQLGSVHPYETVRSFQVF